MKPRAPDETRIPEETLARVRSQAFKCLNPRQVHSTNLHVDRKLHLKGAGVGHPHDKLRIKRDSVLVFADDHPLANFGHDCRYLLFDPASGEQHGALHASFPPYRESRHVIDSLHTFHCPVPTHPRPNGVRIKLQPRAAAPVRSGKRYAILYCGHNNPRFMNDLEFSYRALVDHFAFDPADVHVLFYNKTLKGDDGKVALWPGDASKFRMRITHPGDRDSFKKVLGILQNKLTPDDLLFIHTSGHGFNNPDDVALGSYPQQLYPASDFCRDLAQLPPFRSLLVLMGQCFSGGFNEPIIKASTASNTSVASAAKKGLWSHATSDGCWDAFSRDWIAAQLGHEPNGVSIAPSADANGDGAVDAAEAFAYASTIGRTYPRNLLDTPTLSQSAPSAAAIILGELRAPSPGLQPRPPKSHRRTSRRGAMRPRHKSTRAPHSPHRG
jgi:hypothetical protein